MRFERLRYLSAERNIGCQVANDTGLLLQCRNKAEFSQKCLSRTGWQGNNGILGGGEQFMVCNGSELWR
jgi:hypothetical protein